jgi:3D (Asp-Asp-Asp) domain-containing protein
MAANRKSPALWYLPAFVRRPGRGLRTASLAAAAAVACATLAAAVSAETAAELERHAESLRSQNARLAAGSQSALVGLKAIEARLTQTRSELRVARARAATVRSRRSAVLEELRIARASLRATRRALELRLRALYEQEEADTLAVILGAGSLDAALDAVETLDRAASLDEQLLVEVRSAATRLGRLNRVLAARERELEQLAAVRAAAAASRAAARADRLRTIAEMRSQTRANETRIAGLEERARALASVPGPAPLARPVAPASGVHSLTVVATGYALPGRTASGSRAGWGAVAVDPAVIPLGSRLSVPGYGPGVAADTGGAIQGARIDLWFPTPAEARAWGSRVVTITVVPA